MTNNIIYIQKEIQEFEKNKDEEDEYKINVQITDDSNIYVLQGQIIGPPDTPYDKGIFFLNISLDEDYPIKPPKINFTTKIWHPNISSVTGMICIDILSKNWQPTFTLKSVLLTIQTLLAFPEPNDPQDAVVANQYIENKDMFESTARFWSYFYAHAPLKENNINEIFNLLEIAENINKLGFDFDESINMLSSKFWNYEMSVYELFIDEDEKEERRKQLL